MFYSYCLAFKWHANASLYVLFIEGLFYIYARSSIHQLCGFYAAVVPGPCGFSIQRTAVSRPQFMFGGWDPF